MEELGSVCKIWQADQRLAWLLQVINSKMLSSILPCGVAKLCHFLTGFSQVFGQKGALKIAALLESRGVKLSFLLDEGSAILDGIIAGVKKPVAL